MLGFPSNFSISSNFLLPSFPTLRSSQMLRGFACISYHHHLLQIHFSLTPPSSQFTSPQINSPFSFSSLFSILPPLLRSPLFQWISELIRPFFIDPPLSNKLYLWCLLEWNKVSWWISLPIWVGLDDFYFGDIVGRIGGGRGWTFSTIWGWKWRWWW